MSVILGINAFHAGSAAALVIDGRPVAAIAEERLNRVKYYAHFPKLAIRRCLEMAGVGISDIDSVAIARDPSTNLGKKIQYALAHPSRLPNLFKIRSAGGRLNDIKRLIASECEVDPARLRFHEHRVEHHLAHIAAAYFISDWDYSAGFSVDGSGDFVTSMMAECRGDEIKIRNRVYVPHSLGSLYTMVCEFLGYGKYGDEGKVMGLAPYGQDAYHEIFQDMIQECDSGMRLNPQYFMPFGANQGLRINQRGEMEVQRHYSPHMRRLFGEPREPYSDISGRDRDLAFGLQRRFEQIYFHLLNALHVMVPTERVAIAGGCALNSCANGKLFDHTPFRQTCIQPAAGDDGLALGAALYVSRAVLKEGRRYVMRDAYLGPEFSESQIQTELDRRGVRYRRYEPEPLVEAAVKAITDGQVLGWFQGRMEWGPRALGNRSILADPTRPDMKDILNARVKRRESFRPFAPSVLAARQSEVFEHDHPSPFMLHVYKLKPEWRRRLPAVNHVDNTGRLQTVTSEENPLYHRLISSFERRTGVPLLLNTSFNENEPIVCDPAEAVDCFLRTRMDALAIGPFYCEKAE